MIKPPYISVPGRLMQTKGTVIERDIIVTKISNAGSITSVRTPNWRNLTSRQRKRINNPFSYGFTQIIRKEGTITYKQWEGPDRVTFGDIGHDQCSAAPFPTFRDDSQDKARSKVLSRLKSSSINLGQAFAERKQTVNLIATNVNRIATAALAIRRGNLKHASELFGVRVSGKRLKSQIPPSPSNLSNHWLEYSYGWRPLVNDIYGAAEAIAKTYGNLPLITAVSAVGKFEGKKVDRFTGTGVGVNMRSECQSTSRYVLHYTEDDTFSRVMSQTGISNPLLLAWELVPYSFVVDWFIPLGTYLSNLNASNGLVFKQGTLTTKRKETNVSSIFADPFYSGPGHSASKGGLTRFYESKSRSVLSSFPMSTIPSMSFDLSVPQVLSGLALLTQVFKR